MRRRCNPNDTRNGIFILASPDLEFLSGKNKYHGPRQRNRCSLLFFGIAIISLSLVLIKKPPDLFAALNPFGKHPINDINTLQREQSALGLADSTASEREFSTPSKGLNSDELTDDHITTHHEQWIPRRLLFTYKYNLLDPSVTDPPFDPEDPFTANVLHTIESYQKFWNASSSRSEPHPEEKMGKEEFEVSFLSDSDCLNIIAKVEPRLVKHYSRERKGYYKADICRVSELYLHGGYFFDVDIGVIEPLDLNTLDIPPAIPNAIGELRMKGERLNNPRIVPGKNDIATFSIVHNRHGQFIQSFTAATPHHPVLKRSLEYMVAYFEKTLEQTLPENIIEEARKSDNIIPSRFRPAGMGPGAYTLSMAHRLTTNTEWEEYVRGMMKDRGYSIEHERKKSSRGDIVAKRRYSRFLYEISLDDDEVTRLKLWADVPRQDAEYQRKVKWCNYVCFAGRQVYFYLRVPGTIQCPLEKKFV